MAFVSQDEGRLRSHKLEYNLVDHCNLACRDCSHLSPYLNRHSLPVDVFVHDLNRLAEVYRVERFRFVGGEPLLNRDILRFVRAVRQSGIAKQIEVVTNGVLLDRVPDELFDEIDVLSVSLYPDSGCQPSTIQGAQDRCQRFGVRMRVERIDRFRRTQVSVPIADADLVRGIFHSCLIAHTWGCQTFYDGFFYLCSRPIYTDEFLQKAGHPAVGFRRADGVALHEPNLKERLRQRLTGSEPLAACRFCLGTIGQYHAHSMLEKADRHRPRPDPSPVEASVDEVRLKYLSWWRSAETALLRIVPSRRLARVLAMVQTAVIRD